MREKKVSKKSESELVQVFWLAPMDALFNEVTIALVTGCSIKTLQCDRWRKSRIPFRKISGRVLYRKSDVIAYIESHPLIQSTSEYKNR